MRGLTKKELKEREGQPNPLYDKVMAEIALEKANGKWIKQPEIKEIFVPLDQPRPDLVWLGFKIYVGVIVSIVSLYFIFRA